jgi:hypothetical protein
LYISLWLYFWIYQQQPLADTRILIGWTQIFAWIVATQLPWLDKVQKSGLIRIAVALVLGISFERFVITVITNS